MNASFLSTGLVVAVGGRGFVAVGGFGNHFDAAHEFEEADEAATDDGLVLHDGNADHAAELRTGRWRRTAKP